MHFVKYHALGNDYLVFDAARHEFALTAEQIQRVCHRNFGIGSDGILVRVPDAAHLHHVRIFNPDGSEAEKSGNGLRIFARWLFDESLVGEEPFHVQTLGGQVRCCILQHGRAVQVDMGRVVFEGLESLEGLSSSEPSESLSTLSTLSTAMNKPGFLKKPGLFITHIANIGNPHCVIFRDRVSSDEAKAIGPLIENHPRFPKRTNVQFVQVLDAQHIRLEIWERGAGYTLASGSSSCAAAAVAVRLGLCHASSPITAIMPGGELQIELSANFDARLTGGVTRVAEVEVCDEMFQNPRPLN